MLPRWPAQSPDLSPIENLWEILKINVKKRAPTTLDELWSVTKEEFMLIPDVMFTKLYESMPKRVAMVIANRGSHT